MLALIIATAALGCDSSSSSPTSPSPLAPFTGQWAGTTAQGEPLSFSVVASGDQLLLASAELAMQLPTRITPDITCVVLGGENRLDLSLSEGLSHPFEGTRFSLQLPADLPLTDVILGSGFLIFEGQLDAQGNASGRIVTEAPLRFLFVTLPCLFGGETTWTARRQ